MPSEITAPMDQSTIRSGNNPSCHICGNTGKALYGDLRDKLFGAPGLWHLKQCTNARCRLIWLDPMPLPEDIGIAYKEYYTHSDNPGFPANWPVKDTFRAYLQRKYGYPLANNVAGRTLKAWLAAQKVHRTAELEFSVMYLSFIPQGRLLEVGCGSGVMLELMQRLGWTVEGVDFDDKASRMARGRGLDVKTGSLEQQNYPDNTFDAITMSHLIEHVPDPRGLVAEVYRVLKPGGKLVVVTPNSASWGHALFGRRWRGLEPPRHLHLFNREAIRRLAEDSRLQVEELRTTIRSANGMFAWSLALKCSAARVVPPANSKPRRALTRLMQFFEWFYLMFNKDAGEELLLIARKP